MWLTIGKEFLLIRRDRVGLFMLLVAPIAVIAAAGFSLAKIYGGRTAPRGEYSVAVLDEDHGAIARAILDALAHQPDLSIIHSSSRLDAEQTVRERKLAVVGIVIPPGTTDAIEHGRSARLILYTDPVKYLQTIKIELALSELCRKISAGAADEARSQTAERTRKLHRPARPGARRPPRKPAPKPLASPHRPTRRAPRPRREFARTSRLHWPTRAIKPGLRSTPSWIASSASSTPTPPRGKRNSTSSRIICIRLDIAHGQFENWFGQLKQLAGSHAADIPPPPAIPTLPADLDLGGINLAPVAEIRDARSKLEDALTDSADRSRSARRCRPRRKFRSSTFPRCP